MEETTNLKFHLRKQMTPERNTTGYFISSLNHIWHNMSGYHLSLLEIVIKYNLIPYFILGEKLGNRITKKNRRRKCLEGQKNQDPGHDPGIK